MVPGAVMALVVLGGLLGWQSAERADSATRLEAARVALAAAEEPFPAAALALRRAAASLGSPGALAPAAVSRLLSRGAAVTMFPTQGEPVTSVGLGPSRVVSVDHSGLIEVFDRGSGARLAQIETDVEQVRWLTLSSDEHWVSVEGKGRITGSEQTGLAWSLPDGQPLVHAPSPPDRFATDRQDTVIASYTDVAQSVLGAWSVSGGNQLWSRISSEPISSLHVAAGVVAVSYVGGSFLLLDAQTGAVRREAMAGLRPLLSPDGRRAFLVQPGSGFQVLDLDSGAALASDPFAPEPVAAFGPGGDLSVVDQAGYGWWLPLSTAGGSVRRMSLTGRAAVVVAWPEGSLIGTREGRVLEARRGQVTHTAWLHHGRVTGLAADARGVLSGALDGSVIYQPHAGELLGLLEVRRTPGDARSVWGGAGGVAWQDDDGLAWEDDQGPGRDVGRLARLVSIGEDGQRTIFADDRVVSMRDGVSLRVPGETIDTRPIDLLMLDDGALLVTSGAVYRLWADQETRKIPLPVLKVSRLTPAGDLLLASFGKNTTVAVLETRTGQWIQTLSLPEAHQPGIAALSEVSGGEVFAGTWDGALIGWTLETGEARELAQLDAAVHIVAVSAARIAAASWDQHIRVWDRQAGTLLWDIFFPAGARTLLWLSGGDSLLVGTTEGDLYAFGHAGELRSVRAAVEGSAIERTWLREDGSIAVLSAAGDWQRWDPARLVEGYSSLSAAGALSNLRVCRDTLEVVPVVPFPDPGSAWAPDAACLPP